MAPPYLIHLNTFFEINSYSYFFLTEDGFFPIFVTLVISGCILTFSQFLCASQCSAVTASLVGVGKSVLQTIIGFFTFGGVRFHPLNIIGLLLNTTGGILYSYVKYYESERKKLAKHPSMDSLLSEQTASDLTASNGGYVRRHRGSLTEDHLNRGLGDSGIWMNTENNDDSIKYEDERN